MIKMIAVLCLTALEEAVMDVHVQGHLQLIHSFYWGNSANKGIVPLAWTV